MVHQGIHYISTLLGHVLVIVLLMSFVLLNYFGIRLFARINAMFTLWKIVIPCITIIFLLNMSYYPKDWSLYGGFMPYGWQGIMSAMSSGGVLFSLLGFRQVVIMMGEIKNPGKYVPLILISSLVLTTLLYVGLQWCFLGSIRPQDLSHGWAHLAFAGDAGPFAALAMLGGITWLALLLYLDAFISPYSTSLVYTTTSSHMLSSMSTIGDVPKSLALRNKYDVPWLGLTINCLLAILMSFLLHNWQEMAAFLVAVLMASYAIGPICLICLRQQVPEYPRPFRLRYGTLISFIGFYVCTAGVYWSGWGSVKKLIGLAILGLIFIVGYEFSKYKTLKNLDYTHANWLFLYILGLGMYSYLGNYGGISWIPLHWDLFYLMVFTFFAFGYAYLSKKSAIYTRSIVKMIKNS